MDVAFNHNRKDKPFFQFANPKEIAAAGMRRAFLRFIRQAFRKYRDRFRMEIVTSSGIQIVFVIERPAALSLTALSMRKISPELSGNIFDNRMGNSYYK